MQALRWIVITILWTLACGEDNNQNPEVQNYKFRYFVNDESTGDFKSHEESKIGDTVSGQYKVGEPTGHLRVVKYTADEGGFRADVKYEEGGSPISEKQGRDTSARTGYEFQWLPANPDDVEATGRGDSDENVGAENESIEKQTGENLEDISSGQDISTPMSKQETSSDEQETSSAEEASSMGQEVTGLGQGTTSVALDTSEQSTQSLDNGFDTTLNGENSSEENIDSSIRQTSSEISDENAKAAVSSETSADLDITNDDLEGTPTDSKEDASSSESEEKNSNENPPVSSDEIAIPDSFQVEKESGPEQEPKSDETKESSSEENPLPEPESKSEESKEESAEAAESAPEAAATEPSHMYLPVLPPFQNIPSINFPMPMGAPQIESNSPTIIYAYQNFYNPWQWMGSRRVARDEPPVEQANPVGGEAQYMSSLGYLIMPRPQE